MNRTPTLGLVGLCLLTLSSCATSGSSGAAHRTAMEREDLVTVTAVDVPNRLVTVRGASGESLTVYVDESNKSFPQAGVGDQVRIRYVDSMAFRVTSKPTTGLQISESTTRPGKGHASGRTTKEVTAVVRIEAVNPDGSLVSFTGPRGRRAVQIVDPATREYVRQLNSGDHVEVTYEEALALSLEKVTR